MSFDTYNAPLVLKPKYSLQLAIFIIGLHSIAIIFVSVFFPANWIYKALIILLIGISGFYYYRLHSQKCSYRSIQQVSLSADNQWQVMTASDQTNYTAELLPTSMISRMLIVLNFKIISSSKRYTLIIPNDAIEHEQARKLRARIRVASL